MKIKCCKGNSSCENVDMLERGIKEVQEDIFQVVTPDTVIKIKESYKFDYQAVIELSNVKKLKVRCEKLNKTSDDDLYTLLRDILFNWEEVEDDYDITNEDKLETVIGALNFSIPTGCNIEVVESKEINGWTDGKDIALTSEAIEQLSEGELAFLISHELGHIHNKTLDHKVEYEDKVSKSIEKTLKSEDNMPKKTLKSALKISGSIVGASLLSQAHELGADAKAKEIITEADYSEDDAIKLLDRIGRKGSLLNSHPSGQLRKNLIK